MSQGSFTELMERIRGGDQDAAVELVRHTYEPAIRRAVRFRLTDSHMRSAFDSQDLCQSVLASFFLRAASGQYDLSEPEDLQKLLVAMARNKLRFHVRKEHAQRRDRRRLETVPDQGELVGTIGTPSRQVSAQEMLQEVHKRLSPEERQLVKWRNQGLEWVEIAGRAKGSAEALRKQLARALDRVAVELGVDEDGHD